MIVAVGILRLRIMVLVDQRPPKESPSSQRIPKSVWSTAADVAA